MLFKLIKIETFFLFLLTFSNIFGQYPKIITKITAKESFKLVPEITPKIQSIPNVKSLCSILLDNQQITAGYAPIKDGKLYYEIEGNGIPIVLLNPGPGGTHHFFHPYFSKASKFAKIIYYDMRGTGKSSQSEDLSKYSIKQAIKDLEDLRKFLKIEKWIVLGWSFGGFLAQCYSLIHPENVFGLILVASDTAGFNNIDFGESRQTKYIHKEEQEKIQEIYSKSDLSEEEIVYNINLNGDWKRQNLYKPSIENIARQALYEWQPAQNFRNIIGFDRLRVSFDNEFENFKLPTLILEGAKDLTFSKEKARLFAQLHKKAKLIVFKNAAHKIFEDEQENFFIEIRKFINFIKKRRNNIISSKKSFSLPKSNSLIYKITTTIESLNKIETENIFKKASKTNLNDFTAWLMLFYNLFRHKSYKYALLATNKTIELHLEKNTWMFELLVWKGHILDLLNKRNRAITCYRKSLQFENGQSNDFFGDEIEINKEWVKERLKIPFKIL